MMIGNRLQRIRQYTYDLVETVHEIGSFDGRRQFGQRHVDAITFQFAQGFEPTFRRSSPVLLETATLGARALGFGLC